MIRLITTNKIERRQKERKKIKGKKDRRDNDIYIQTHTHIYMTEGRSRGREKNDACAEVCEIILHKK